MSDLHFFSSSLVALRSCYNSRMLKFLSSDAELQDITRTAAKSGTHLFISELSKPYDAKAFYDSIRRTFPLDPPIMMVGGKLVWDALSDSLVGGLATLDAKRIAIIWRNHTEMQRISPDNYRIALSVLEQVQEELGLDEVTMNNHKDVEIYLA